MGEDFEPKIVGFLCNWCPSTFFFVEKSSAGSGSAKKNVGEKEISPTPAHFFQFYHDQEAAS
jgi:hypothetical protein